MSLSTRCEPIGIRGFDNTVRYKIDGREARLCYNERRCVLELLQDGKVKFNFDLPLMVWDEAREMGAYWVDKAVVPSPDKHAA